MPAIPKPMPRGNMEAVERSVKKQEAEHLRDQFAMAALTGLLASPRRDTANMEAIAVNAWLMADVMIETRNRP